MDKVLGVLIFVLGAAVLGLWGAQNQAVSMQNQIEAAAQQVVAGAAQPMHVSVSGRDITLTGTADSKAELDGIVARLDAIPGRRVVNAGDVAILPEISPYDTALVKAADGSLVVTGYAPTAKAREALLQAGLPADKLPLGHGAPAGWQATMLTGAAALSPLDEGSFTLTGPNLTLSGVAATPDEAQSARLALEGLGAGYDPAISISVKDPGVVSFGIEYEAATGLTLTGIIPRGLGRDGLTDPLGVQNVTGEVGTTFADVPGLAGQLAALGKLMGRFDRAEITGSNDGLAVSAEAMPGLDPDALANEIRAALGDGADVTVNPASPPADGAERINRATGRREEAHAGYWLAVPDFKATKPACTAAAQAAVATTPIRFVTGSAALDPATLMVVNNVAGVILHCTEGAGMRVLIGGHTDATGDATANYSLSLARARAVRDALAARGVAPGRMQAIGYGATEPVAANETEAGRAQNRRTSFEWP